MTPQEVIKSEDYNFFVNLTANEMPSGYVILSSTEIKIEDIETIFTYIFKDNGLISASYWFHPKNKFKFD